jgi:multidrug efflux pump subunit AcrB
MAVSILFSAFLALSLTPALCATLLKPLPRASTTSAKASSAGSTAASTA